MFESVVVAFALVAIAIALALAIAIKYTTSIYNLELLYMNKKTWAEYSRRPVTVIQYT